jgi:hypothetical protein
VGSFGIRLLNGLPGTKTKNQSQGLGEKSQVRKFDG